MRQAFLAGVRAKLFGQLRLLFFFNKSNRFITIFFNDSGSFEVKQICTFLNLFLTALNKWRFYLWTIRYCNSYRRELEQAPEPIKMTRLRQQCCDGQKIPLCYSCQLFSSDFFLLENFSHSAISVQDVHIPIKKKTGGNLQVCTVIQNGY